MLTFRARFSAGKNWVCCLKIARRDICNPQESPPVAHVSFLPYFGYYFAVQTEGAGLAACRQASLRHCPRALHKPGGTPRGHFSSPSPGNHVVIMFTLLGGIRILLPHSQKKKELQKELLEEQRGELVPRGFLLPIAAPAAGVRAQL